MKDRIKLGEATLPLTLQVWDTGAMSLCDSRGYFVVSVAPEHAARLAQLFLPAVVAALPSMPPTYTPVSEEEV